MKKEPILTRKSVEGLKICRDVYRFFEAIHPLKSIGLFAALEKTSADAGERLSMGIKFLSAKHQRLFACDCAERALKCIGKPDPRSLEAIKVSRAYANGTASKEELKEARREAVHASRDAADAYNAASANAEHHATHDACAACRASRAGDAEARVAYDAANAAHADAYATTIARDAVDAYANAAARYASYDAAARDKEHLWQLNRLRFYLRREYA